MANSTSALETSLSPMMACKTDLDKVSQLHHDVIAVSANFSHGYTITFLFVALDDGC